jgi:hypothetical protein
MLTLHATVSAAFVAHHLDYAATVFCDDRLHCERVRER